LSKLFVVSAPSGCGKTTLCRRLLADKLGLVNSVSMTTRPPRPGEEEGVDYRFVSRADFEKMALTGGFLEHEENFGRLYGTPKKLIEDNLKKGSPVLLSIDVKGAMKVKRAYPKESILIFLVPPSVADLRKRLMQRKSDGPLDIAARLEIAKKELSYKAKYDYTVVNDSLDSAYRKLKKIVLGELKEG